MAVEFNQACSERRSFLSLTGHTEWAGHHNQRGLSVVIRARRRAAMRCGRLPLGKLRSLVMSLLIVFSGICSLPLGLMEINEMMSDAKSFKMNFAPVMMWFLGHAGVLSIQATAVTFVYLNGRKEVRHGGTESTMQGLQPALAQSGRQSLFQPPGLLWETLLNSTLCLCH